MECTDDRLRIGVTALVTSTKLTDNVFWFGNTWQVYYFTSAITWTSNTGHLFAAVITSDDEYARTE